MTYDNSLDSLLIGLALCLFAVLVTLTANAYTAVCRALDTRTDRRARRAAKRADRTPCATAHDDTVAIALNEACCERWWTSCGFHHEPTCPHQHRQNT